MWLHIQFFFHILQKGRVIWWTLTVCKMWCIFYLLIWMNFPVPAEIQWQHIRRSSIREGDSHLCNKPSPRQDHIWCEWTSPSNKWCQKAYATSENIRSWTLSNPTFKGSQFGLNWCLDSGMMDVPLWFEFLL
jgi:hypothetical protein